MFVDESGGKGKQMKKEVRKLHVLYSEETFRDRTACARGPYHQLESVTVVTRNNFDFPEVKRNKFTLLSSTNRGDAVGAMCWHPWNKSWAEKSAVKKQILGPNRVDVGGAGPENVPPMPTNTEGNEVVLWHCMSEDYYVMLLEDWPIAGTIDLSPGQGLNALAHLRSRIPYLGVCFTPKHVDLLYERLYNRAFAAMLTEADSLYDPALANLVHSAKKKKQVGRPQARPEEQRRQAPQRQRRQKPEPVGAQKGGQQRQRQSQKQRREDWGKSGWRAGESQLDGDVGEASQRRGR